MKEVLVLKGIIKYAAAVMAAAITVSAVLPINTFAQEDKPMEIIIDGLNANKNETMLYRGAGMVSGNNSSRLLLDYKAENPDAYWEILNYIFGDKGIGITHLKLEMGADINSSSGTEPCVKRTADEAADVTRGAGYQLAADAKTINPDLTLDMLWWGEPKWITDAEDVYAARYSWYKETLDAAYTTYGLKFDYVSVVQNERSADSAWIKYISSHLKSETNAPYDYSKIKIVGGEEVCTWGFADAMLADEELMDAVDVVGSHYTSTSSDSAQKLAAEYGKELWFSEASSPMSYAQGTYRFDDKGSGIADINGALDIANRIITMYPMGDMTLYEYQPVVSAYYDGVTYCQKQLISACDPWSGYYYLDSGFFMSLHFSQFIKKGWAFVDGACYADGVAGGDGHAIVDAKYSYMTATDTATGDYSTVITNTTAEPITYNFTVSNVDKASSAVDVWETRGPDGEKYDENYFKKTETITPVAADGKYTYSVTVKPYSIITVSTVALENTDYSNADESERTVLSLPYADDYEYAGYPDDYLASRGNAPRYTTDEGGAFEVVNVNGNNVLMQKITADSKANEWGATPNPTTNFGDDRWYNYSVSADVTFAESAEPSENYTGVGLRYNLADLGQSGYWIKLKQDGSWQLYRNTILLEEGSVEGFDGSKTHNIKVEAFENTVCAYVDSAKVCEYVSTDKAVLSAGRAALYSSYNLNSFDNLLVSAVDGYDTYVTRYDNTDACFEYTGDWEYDLMSTFKNYKRTFSTGTENASVTLTFEGTGFLVTGLTSGGVISVEIDGKTVEDAYSVLKTGFREGSYSINGLENKEHKAVITVKSGKYHIDGVQISGGKIYLSDENSAKGSFPVIPVAIGAGVLAVGAAAAIIIAKKKKKK